MDCCVVLILLSTHVILQGPKLVVVCCGQVWTAGRVVGLLSGLTFQLRQCQMCTVRLWIFMLKDYVTFPWAITLHFLTCCCSPHYELLHGPSFQCHCHCKWSWHWTTYDVLIRVPSCYTCHKCCFWPKEEYLMNINLEPRDSYVPNVSHRMFEHLISSCLCGQFLLKLKNIAQHVLSHKML